MDTVVVVVGDGGGAEVGGDVEQQLSDNFHFSAVYIGSITWLSKYLI